MYSREIMKKDQMFGSLEDTAKRLGTTFDKAFIPVLVVCTLDLDKGIMSFFEV